MGKIAILTAFALLFLASCPEGESVEEHNKKLKEAADVNKPKGKVVKVKTAVPGGTKIPCDKLLDASQLTDILGEKEPITLSDQTKAEAGATSVCSIRRGGEIMDALKQEAQVKKTMKLGVLAGDELCNIAAFCSIPADEEQFKAKCKRDIEKVGHSSYKDNEAVGTYACIKVTPKGPDDAFTYQFIDPDSRCTLRVRGGPSVNEEAEIQKCAKAAFLLIGPDSLP